MKEECKIAGAFEKCGPCAYFRDLSDEKKEAGKIACNGICKAEGEEVIAELPIEPQGNNGEPLPPAVNEDGPEER
jgi:hypothetical protein